MKKTLIALAVLTVSSAAFAQSTVTISGRMDATLRHTAKVAPNAANLALTEDGGANTVRFAIAEDLGGGLKAVADLGMRFQIADGINQGSGARPLFQGESRVGVTGGFGTVKFGRGLTALQAPNGGNSDPWGVTTSAGSVYAAGFATDYAAGGEGRIDGALFYTSPSINGLTLSVSMSPKKLANVGVTAATADTATKQGTSEVAAITSTKTHQSISAVYAAGDLLVGAGYEQNRVGDTLTQIFGNYNLGVAKVFASTATIKGGTAADRAGNAQIVVTKNLGNGVTHAVLFVTSTHKQITCSVNGADRLMSFCAGDSSNFACTLLGCRVSSCSCHTNVCQFFRLHAHRQSQAIDGW